MFTKTYKSFVGFIDGQLRYLARKRKQYLYGVLLILTLNFAFSFVLKRSGMLIPFTGKHEGMQPYIEHSQIYIDMVELLFGNKANLPFENYIKNAKGEQVKQPNYWYPHTNLKPEFAQKIISSISPSFLLELGSFEGGSANIWASTLKTQKNDSLIVCMDPWTGDVNMWEWKKEWLGPLFSWGEPAIYNQFMANIIDRGHHDVIIPMKVTSIVGMRFFDRMIEKKRWEVAPQVMYLDSSHLYEETLMELKVALKVLAPGGVIAGDDWVWGGVRGAVKNFVKEYRDKLEICGLHGLIASRYENDLIQVYDNQWCIKKRNE